jgi:hypothetical protein
MSRKVLLQKLTVAQLVKEFPVFMEPKVSLLCSQEPAIAPYHKPDKPNHHPHFFPLYAEIPLSFLLVRSCRRIKPQDLQHFLIFWNFIVFCTPSPTRQSTTPADHDFWQSAITCAVYTYLHMWRLFSINNLRTRHAVEKGTH